MHIQHNYLRKHRKVAKLAQSDISFITGVNDITNISRYEQGVRLPNVPTLLAYEILFGAPLSAIYERQAMALKATLVERVRMRIKALRETTVTDFRIRRRIENLEILLEKFEHKQTENA